MAAIEPIVFPSMTDYEKVSAFRANERVSGIASSFGGDASSGVGSFQIMELANRYSANATGSVVVFSQIDLHSSALWLLFLAFS